MNTASNVQVIDVTPKLAQSYLETNSSNRPLSIRTVNELTRAILNDEWQRNGESMKFDRAGNMIDGQHRCHAVIKADRAIQTYVLFDLPSDSFKTLDTGKKRNNADTLGLLGFSNPALLAAVCRFVANFKTNQLRSSELVTNIRMEQFIDTNPEIVDSMNVIKSSAVADERPAEEPYPGGRPISLPELMGRPGTARRILERALLRRARLR